MKLFDYLLDWILPNRCGFCEDFIKWDKLACDDCIKEIEYAEDFIQKDSNGYFTFCVYASEYRDTAREGALNLKYHQGINTAKFFLPKLIENLSSMGVCDEIDLVTAVPMNRKRYYETGYNHAEIVADIVSNRLGIKKNYNILGKNRSTSAQHELSQIQRYKAVKGSYFIKRNHFDIKGMTILLCDDIITTGSTLSECSRLLLEAGAERVYCLALESTPYKEGN